MPATKTMMNFTLIVLLGVISDNTPVAVLESGVAGRDAGPVLVHAQADYGDIIA